MELKEGDQILMCSDGLTDMLEDEEIFEIINEKQNTEDAVRELIEAANDYGGNDNITVILTEPFSGEVKIC